MAGDARVESAIAHWAPRFVANGVPLTDFQEVTASVARWEDWCSAWCRRAAVHEEIGRKALADGYNVSAGQHLNTAAVCYHFAKFVFVNDYEQMRGAHMHAVECHRLALPHLRFPGQRVEIPYQGRVLYGNLRLPQGDGRAPLVVMCMGLDSAKEEMNAYETVFLERGLATLSFDGPGQGEAEYDFAIRGDYEVTVRTVIDWLQGNTAIDAQRIGLWGVSLGGYYAPRAAAFEPRVQACIALSGPYDFAALWQQLPLLTRETFRVRAKCASDEAGRRHAATLSLEGVAAQIRCPLYVVAGKQDRLVPWQDAERLAKEASGPVELLAIEDGNHVANNRTYRYRNQTADWMASRLGGGQ
ncbi:MAG TPA: alpha/beta fold hydrolase [Burkholderiales bacterium]|nr:alpha/beta fold hydrolase [Burkholderiales bacterium]